MEVSKIRCQLTIKNSDELFNHLEVNKETIENELNFELEWINLENVKRSIIRVLTDGDISEAEKWDDYFAWLLEKAENFTKVFPKYLKNFNSNE